MRTLRRVARLVLALVVMMTTSVGCAGQAGTASDAEFFKGKTVTMVVPHGAGGGMDTYARMVAPYLGKYLGATVVIDNASGAGGLVGRNKIYQAKPDGLTIGFTLLNGAILAEWAELDGVQYKTEDFRMIGKIYSEANVMVVSAKSKFKTIDDVIKAGKIRAGFSGVGSDDYYGMHLAAKALGFDIDAITGFAGAKEANLAVVKGEVEAVQGTYGTMSPLIESGDVIPVLVYHDARIPELPNVPTALEKVPAANKKTMEGFVDLMKLERIMFAPPKLPDGKLQVLRDALAKALKDPEFTADSVKNKRPVSYASGEDVEKMMKTLVEVKSILKPQVIELTKKSQG
jgi:tripartite-type tricarboxylate transporter receptor subunit TctC